MDSQKLLSWRDPNYTAKFNHYILEEGIHPNTLESATAEEVQTAEWYNRIHPITETFSWGTALYSAYVGYNQYHNKLYTNPPKLLAYVATPSNIEAFPDVKPGSVFTEFDVNSQSLYPAGKEGWGQIPGPGSLIDRLNQKKGLPAITEMPDARNINIKGEK